MSAVRSSSGQYLWKYGTRIALPNARIALVAGKKNSNALTFRTDLPMTKFEIKQLLTRVYGLNVRKVNTLAYEAKKRRSRTQRGVWDKARSGYKKAYVYLSDAPIEKGTLANMVRHDANVQQHIADRAETQQKE